MNKPTPNQPTNPHMQLLLTTVDKISTLIGRQKLAIILASIANLLWPLAFIFVNQNKLSPFETNLSRGISVILTHFFICQWLGMGVDFISGTDIKYLLIRNTIIVLHQLYYSAMQFVVTMPIVNIIALSGPLFVFIIDYFINGVTINKKQLMGIALGMLGVVTVINGDAVMHFLDQNYQAKSNFKHYVVEDVKIKILLSFVGVLTNVAWAYAMVIQKNIKHVPGIKISYFLGIELIFSSGFVFACGTMEPVKPILFFKSIIYSGCIMAFCQVLFISSLNLTKNTGILTMLMLLYIFPSYFLSFFRYGQPLNIICLIGLVLMGYGLGRAIFNKNQ